MITHPTSLLEDGWIADFRRDGYVVVDGFFDDPTVARLGARFAPLFGGEFESGRVPDAWPAQNTTAAQPGVRHIVNAWKSDRTIAQAVLSAEIGELAATLADWPGTRLGHDTLCWPAANAESDDHDHAASLGFLDPARRLTFVIVLDKTAARGTQDDAPGAGACIIYDSLGRGATSRRCRIEGERRTIRVETLSSAARFRQRGTGFPYGRYQRFGSSEMDETFFPVLWTREGYRSPSIGEHFAAEADPSRLTCSPN